MCQGHGWGSAFGKLMPAGFCCIFHFIALGRQTACRIGKSSATNHYECKVIHCYTLLPLFYDEQYGVLLRCCSV